MPDVMRKPRRSPKLSHLVATLFGVGAGLSRFLPCLFRSRSALIAENLFLRKQLAFYREREIKPRRLTDAARICLLVWSRLFNWREVLVIVKPETLVVWHRKGFRLFWKWKSKGGRPRLLRNIRRLIAEMAAENPTWGEERVADELAIKLGVYVSPRTVRAYWPEEPLRSGPRSTRPQHWCTFVRNHARAILAHERLSIVDVEHGAQPLVDVLNGNVLAVNGEVYNHKDLRAGLRDRHDFQTASDCEVILYMYEELSPREFLNRMNGIFAFVLYDPQRNTFLIARDPIGVVPLYVGWDRHDHLYVASEMKALVGYCERIREFPPGHYYLDHEANRGFQRYYEPKWMEEGWIPRGEYDPAVLRQALENAVRRQLMCDVPYGVLISGGVDSSIIASVAAKFSEGRVEEEGKSPAWWPRIHSFSIGLKDAPDLGPARRVADHIGAVHHEIHFAEQEGLDALSDVIYHIETFDLTTVRASTPMYLMMRKIRTMGIKMVLSGEGADEVFGGYLYFHKAPNSEELHKETVRKLQKLHLYDCLRANKSSAAWGVEARVPFLDREFLDAAMMLDPQNKLPYKSPTPRPMEKYILRNAFRGYIPHEVLWRQKEQFSDGVGYGWIQALKDHAEREVTDDMMRGAAERFPVKTPETKEGYLYRQLFELHFPSATAVNCVPFERSVACSTAIALEWDEAFNRAADPSGRSVIGVHRPLS